MLPTTTSSNNNSSNEPPPPNPMLTAYEGWAQRTPLVTRSILTIQTLSYLTSWFINLDFALATIPYYVVLRFEFYRLVLSPLVNTRIFSCIFAFLSFSDHGRRLEQSLGSTAFGWLCLSIGLLTNVGFVLISFVLSFLRGFDESFLFSSADGLWTIIFGIIAMECVQAPRNTQRAFLFFAVPVIYYPLVLFFFFSLLGGDFSLSYLVSMGVGYAGGFGYLDKVLKLNQSKAKQWEDTILSNYVRREGWIASHAATGSDAWHDAASAGISIPTLGGNGGSSSTSTGRNGDTSSGSRAGSVFRTGTRSNTANAEPSFPASSGRTLGTGGSSSSSRTRRSAPSGDNNNNHMNSSGNTAAETRAARLQALERQTQAIPTDNNNAERQV